MYSDTLLLMTLNNSSVLKLIIFNYGNNQMTLRLCDTTGILLRRLIENNDMIAFRENLKRFPLAE